MKKKIGAQLYSVRNELSKDFDGVISKIAGMGYDGVELAGLPAGVTPEKAVKLFKSLGLGLSGGHMALPVGENKNKAIDDAKALGITTIIGGKGPNDFKTPELVKKSCEIFNEAANAAKDAGLRVAIHNHWWEFGKIDGRLVFDMMLEQLDPCVFFEVDTYWVKTGGSDPVSIVKSLGKRAPLLHIKDGPCVQGQPMLAVGKGAMDFPPILKVADHAEWLVVELDECATDMLEALRESLVYLKTAVK
ncbi:MAG: sugar phosphate isomerase/epimerase [Victivallales bacterium]|jgi:sugar phosphate isomerase/epimerase